jgi:hypothetical protein
MPLYEPLARGPYVDPFRSETIVQALVTVITNAAGLPLVVRSFRNGDHHAGVVGGATALFSAMYHLADTLNAKLFSMTPGNWCAGGVARAPH